MTDISYICPKAGQKNKTKQTQKKHIIAVGGGGGKKTTNYTDTFESLISTCRLVGERADLRQ